METAEAVEAVESEEAPADVIVDVMDPSIPPPPPAPPSFDVEPADAAAAEAQVEAEVETAADGEVAEAEVAEPEAEQAELDGMPPAPEAPVDFFEPIDEFIPEPVDVEGDFDQHEFEQAEFAAAFEDSNQVTPHEAPTESSIEEAEVAAVLAAVDQAMVLGLSEEEVAAEIAMIEAAAEAEKAQVAEAAAEQAEVTEVTEQDIPVAEAPESSPAELPPLTLAPGPLLFDGDDNPIATTGSYDVDEEEPAAELTALVPADFTDLIPADIVHGDLARHGEAAAPDAEPVAEVADVVAPEPEPVVEAAVQAVAEEAPSTEDLPPMDVAEIPSDVSSIETLNGSPIPTARETSEEPAPAAAHSEGPRGLGYFGG